MAEHRGDFSNIVDAATEADNQISKLRFLCDVLAYGDNHIRNATAAEGAYYILNEIADALDSATQTLFEEARNARRKLRESEHGTEDETEDRSE